MSGILGVWNRNGRPLEVAELVRLSETLTHRGADDHGFEIRGPVGIACRLARITPEAVHERQPVVDASGAILVFDGRLDNRDELLAALKGSRDVSHEAPDSVLAMAAYRAFGDAFPERLNGDFALGVFDPGRRQILLARDAIGVRPLYYFATDDLFLFASEIKTLVAHPLVDARPDDDALADFLFNQLYGLQGGETTLFQNVFSLLPGHQAIVSVDKLVTQQYWDFDRTRQVRLGSINEYAEGFRHHLEQSVRRRMRSAGPVAVSVSGGLDSSAIFCAAARLRQSEPNRTPPLLGVSFTSPDGTPSDEKAFLLEIEREHAVEIHRIENVPYGVMNGCADAIWHLEAPFLTQWNASHAFLTSVRQLGARVLLTGHWGDQLLFDDAYLVDLCLHGRWLKAWSHLREYGRWMELTGSSRSLFKRRLVKALFLSSAPEGAIPILRSIRRRLRRTPEVRSVYTDRFLQRAIRSVARVVPGRGASAHAQSLYEEVRCRFYVFCLEWNNKAGLMHGVDHAFPYLDRDLIAFLMAIPGDVQSWEGVPKALLRLSGILPDKIAERRTKADFTRLANNAMAREYDQVIEAIQKHGVAAMLGYVKPEVMGHELARVRSSVHGDESSRTAWAVSELLALELWLQCFFQPAGLERRTSGVAHHGQSH